MKRRGVDSIESWVVAVALSVSYMLYPLPLRLGGQLFVSILDSYQISRYEASFPFSMAFFVRSLGGPFAGYFGNRFGLQETTMVGSIFCVIGVGGCYFAEDIITINIFFGFIYGLGVGITTSLSPEVINQHFKKHRAKSMGIVFGGSSLGVFVFSPLLENILFNYGLSGTFLVMSAILLNSVPATMLLSKPKSEKETVVENTVPLELDDCKSLSLNSEEDVSATQSEIEFKSKELSSLDREEKLHGDMCVILKEDLLKRNIHNYDLEYVKYDELRITSGPRISPRPYCREELENHIHQFQTHTNSTSGNQFCKLHNQQCNEEIDGHSSDPFKKFSCGSKTKPQECITRNEIVPLKVSKINIFRGSKPPLQTCQESPAIFCKSHNSEMDNLEKTDLKKSNILSSKYFSSCSSLSVLWSPLFLVVTYIQSSHFHLTYMLWTIIVDVVRDKGVNENLAVYFVMTLSISDMIGRFALGCITDNGYMTRSNFSAFCFIIMGISTLAMVFVTGFTTTMVAICVLNVACGVNTTALPGIVTQFFQGGRRTLAMASRTLLYVPMSFTMSPLIGYFRGTLGAYDGLFYFLAAMCIITSTLLILLPKMMCLRNK